MTVSPAFNIGRKTTLQVGSGITGASDLVKTSVIKTGDLITTTILIDVDGLNSGGGILDIIGGAAAANCHLGQLNADQVGTIYAIHMLCLETPLTGEPDIDLYSANVATGVEDTAVTSLAGDVALIISGVDYTTGVSRGNVLLPTSGQYLYLACSQATDATYTAGKFVITLYGY